MKVYRLVKEKYAADPLDSEGAKRYGGRWNSKGQAMLYASDTLSLAALELLVHLLQTDILNAYKCIIITLPDKDIAILEDNTLPADWRDDPPPFSTVDIGGQWAQSESSLALSVPSTVIPQQRNLLINPNHPGFIALHDDVEINHFKFDPRLLPQT